MRELPSGTAARSSGELERARPLLALHARIAAEQGDLERAGRLWGALEAEEARAPLGSWGQYRDEYVSPSLPMPDRNSTAP